MLIITKRQCTRKIIYSLLLWGLLIGFSHPVIAQTAEKSVATITYELQHITDTTDASSLRKTSFKVYLGIEGSHYTNHTRVESTAKFLEQLRALGVTASPVVRSNPAMIPVGGGLEELVIYPSREELYKIAQLGQTHYIIQQDFPRIVWEIGSSIKEIAGFQTQEATGSFGGRHYRVWFAPELPFAYGPWKLHGLPGLILEAEDSTGDVRFVYQAFEKMEGEPVLFPLPENAVKASPAQFARTRSAMIQNPDAVHQSNTTSGGTVSTRGGVIVRDNQGNSRSLTGDEAAAERERRRLELIKKNNNPLELIGDRP